MTTPTAHIIQTAHEDVLTHSLEPSVKRRVSEASFAQVPAESVLLEAAPSVPSGLLDRRTTGSSLRSGAVGDMSILIILVGLRDIC